MKYCILIVHMTKAFDAERIKGNSIVFVNHWSDDKNEWSIVECDSEYQRNLLLSIMNNKTEKSQLYTLGYKHGSNKEKYNPNF